MLGGRGAYLAIVVGVVLITLLQSILSVMRMPEMGS
jgi:ribose transport system permease protein